MKIKFLTPLILSVCILTGCTYIQETPQKQIEYDITQYPDKEKALEDIKAYDSALYNNTDPSELKDDISDYLKNNMELIDNISVKQDRGNDIKLYRDTNFKDIICAYDGIWFEYFSGATTAPTAYTDEIDSVTSNSTLHFDTYSVGNTADMLAYANNEFLMTENLHHSIFSLEYKDVWAYFNNVPIKIMVYIKDNNLQKIHISYMQMLYNDIPLSDNNINDIKTLLSTYNLPESIIDDFATSIDKDSYKKDFDIYSVQSIKDIRNNERYSFGDYILSIN